jgi:hypothetical protein
MKNLFAIALLSTALVSSAANMAHRRLLNRRQRAQQSAPCRRVAEYHLGTLLA